MSRLPWLSLLIFALPLPARAEVPIPTYPDCGEEGGTCPSDLQERWWLIDHIPDSSIESVRAAEIPLGSGVAADRAWQTTTGNWDVTIAVTDSGIEWQNTRLVNKVWLNADELPLPQDADGVEAAQHDVDGNGLVNVEDYAADPRIDWTIGVDVADHMLDPSDLIYTFSDGVDDDGNGYADDIAGWDFFSGDNDAWNTYDDDYGHHGTGVMEGAAAEGEDGDNDIGVCPNCSVLPIRVGDTFITDGTRMAQAIAFATDSGAEVVAMAVGALSHSADTRAAIDYADDNGVFLVGAAGDENAYHRNLPAAEDDVLFVHSIRGDNGDEDGGVYSFMNFWNCNNYGPRVELVAPANACATGAVSHISGIAGLMISAGRDLGIELTPSELYQILITTPDDVYLTPEEIEEASAYPSSEGWDPFYGYGRADAARAVEAIRDGEIPPTARLGGPRWFDLFDVGQTDSVDIELWTSADRSGGAHSWTLEYGTGWEPTDWTPLSDGAETAAQEGAIYTLDLSQLPIALVDSPPYDEDLVGRLERVHRPAITLRLTVTDDAGRVGIARKVIQVYEDPDLLKGFPYDMGTSGESSPILIDLTGDGVFEIVVGTASGEVLALYGDGSFVEGWPALTDRAQALDQVDRAPAYTSGAVDEGMADGILATVAAGDLDGDGSNEVVAASLEGRVYAWTAAGEPLDGYPLWIVGRSPEEFDTQHTYDNGIAGAPTLYDLDSDGDLEIIVAAMDSRIYAWHHDGTPLEGYPFEACHPENCGSLGDRIITSVTVGDVDGDGDPDLGFGTNETLSGGKYSITYMYDAFAQTALPGWPRQGQGLIAEAAILPVIGTGHPASLAFADIDNDGDLEIVDAVMLGQPGLLDHAGEEVLDLSYNADRFGDDHNTNEPSFLAMTNNPSFGDLDGDGKPDPMMGGSGTIALVALATTTHVDFQQVVGAWSSATGDFFPGWPQQIEDLQFLMAPAVADVSGDGAPEVIYGSAGGVVHAWDKDGAVPDGWPKFTGQWLLGSTAIGDIDGDGYLDVVQSTREGFLFAWRTAGHADQTVQWAALHHDAANTGNYQTPLPTQAGPDIAASGCCKNRDDAAEAWLVGPLLLLAFGRRSRRERPI